MNKLARAVTKWTRIRDRSLARFDFFTLTARVVTGSVVMWEALPNSADWDCFKTLIFSGDLEDSVSTSGGILFIFGSRTFVQVCWMCKKQTASHSSTESEVISLDGTAFSLWTCAIRLLICCTHHQHPLALGNPMQCVFRVSNIPQSERSRNLPRQKKVVGRRLTYVAPNAKLSHHSALLFIFEDNEAVIKITPASNPNSKVKS